MGRTTDYAFQSVVDAEIAGLHNQVERIESNLQQFGNALVARVERLEARLLIRPNCEPLPSPFMCIVTADADGKLPQEAMRTVLTDFELTLTANFLRRPRARS